MAEQVLYTPVTRQELKDSYTNPKLLMDRLGDNALGTDRTLFTGILNLSANAISSAGNVFENLSNLDKFNADMKVKYPNRVGSAFSIGADLFRHDSTPDPFDKVAKYTQTMQKALDEDIKVYGQTTGSSIAGFGVEIAPYLLPYIRSIGGMSATRTALSSNVEASKLVSSIAKDSLSNTAKFGALGYGIGSAKQNTDEQIFEEAALGAATGFVGTPFVGGIMKGYDAGMKALGKAGVDAPKPTVFQNAGDYIKEEAKQTIKNAFDKLEESPFALNSYIVPNERVPQTVSDKKRTKDQSIALQNVESPVGQGKQLTDRIDDTLTTPNKPRLAGAFYDTGGRQYAESHMLSHQGTSAEKATISRAKFEEGKADEFATNAKEAFEVRLQNNDRYKASETRQKGYEPLSSPEMEYERRLFDVKLFRDISKKIKDPKERSVWSGKEIEAQMKLDEYLTANKSEIDEATKAAITREDIGNITAKDYHKDIKSQWDYLHSKTKDGKYVHGQSEEFGVFGWEDSFKSLDDKQRINKITESMTNKLDRVDYLKASKELEIKHHLDGNKDNLDINNIPDELKLKYPDLTDRVTSYRDRIFDIGQAKRGYITAKELAWRESKRLDTDYSTSNLKGTLKSGEAEKFLSNRDLEYKAIGRYKPELEIKPLSQNTKPSTNDYQAEIKDRSNERVSKLKAIDNVLAGGNGGRYSGSAKNPGGKRLSISELRDVRENAKLLSMSDKAKQLFIDRYMPIGSEKDIPRLKAEANEKWADLVRKHQNKELGLDKAETTIIKNKLHAKEVELDASNSVASIAAAMTGDKVLGNKVFTRKAEDEFRHQIARELSKANDGEFAKLKGEALTKDDVKKVYTPTVYGAGEKTAIKAIRDGLLWVRDDAAAKRLYDAYNDSFIKQAPSLGKLKAHLDDIHSRNTDGKYSWTLPDGFKVDVELSGKNTYRIMEKGKVIGTIDVTSGTADKFSKALMPRLIHSIDAWIARTLRKEFDITSNHDAFFLREGMDSAVEKRYRELLKEVHDTNLADKLIKQLDSNNPNAGFTKYGDISDMFDDSTRKFMSLEEHGAVVKSWNDSKPSRSMSREETMIDFMTKFSHRGHEYHTMVDAMIDEAVHSKTNMAIPRETDDPFERALALALQGKIPVLNTSGVSNHKGLLKLKAKLESLELAKKDIIDSVASDDEISFAIGRSFTKSYNRRKNEYAIEDFNTLLSNKSKSISTINQYIDEITEELKFTDEYDQSEISEMKRDISGFKDTISRLEKAESNQSVMSTASIDSDILKLKSKILELESSISNNTSDFIEAPRGLNAEGTQLWYDTQLKLWNRFRIAAEYNPFLTIRGERMVVAKDGSIIGSTIRDIREIREFEAQALRANMIDAGINTTEAEFNQHVNNVIDGIKTGKTDDLTSKDFDAFTAQKSTDENVMHDSDKAFESSGTFDTKSFASEFTSSAKESFKKQFAKGNELKLEMLNKILKPFGLNHKQIVDFVVKASKQAGVALTRLAQALDPYLQGLKGLDIKFYNKFDEFVDRLADRYPRFAELRDKWKELQFVDPALSKFKEAMDKHGKPAYDIMTSGMKAEHKAKLSAFLSDVKASGQHIGDKYNYTKEAKQFARLLGITAPSKKLADEAGDRLTMWTKDLLKGKNQDEYMTHIFHTDAVSLPDDIVTKFDAEDFMEANADVYNLAKKFIDASADGIGRKENQRGFYANNARVIADEIGKPELASMIDTMITIKAMDKNNSWKWHADNYTTREYEEMMNVARSFKDRSEAIFAYSNDMNLLQKGYIQDSFDIPKVFGKDGKMQHDVSKGFEDGALGFDTMSNRVGDFVQKEADVSAEGISDPYQFAHDNGYKLSARGFFKVADLETRTKMGLKRDLAKMLGNTEASLRRKEAQINSFTYILTHGDKDFNTMFSKEAKDGFVPLTKEERFRLPSIAREDIVFVNKKWKDKIIGRDEFRFASDDAKYGTQVAEVLWKDTVSLFKQNNVLKNLSSFKNAAIVPYVYYMATHNSWKNMAKYTKDSVNAYKEFKAITKEYDLSLSTGRLTPELTKAYENNEVVQMLKAGLSINTLDGVRSHGSLMNNMLSELTGGHLDEITNTIMFNQNSITGHIAKESFSFLDFHGRYMMYKGFLEIEGMKPSNAMMRTNDMFGQMDEIAPHLIDVADKYGMAIFAKWAASVLPAVAKTAKLHPIKALSITIALLYISDKTDTHTSSVSPVETLVDMPTGYISGDGIIFKERNLPKLVPGIYRDMYAQGKYAMSDLPEGMSPAILFKNRLEAYVDKDTGEIVDHRGLIQQLYDDLKSDDTKAQTD